MPIYIYLDIKNITLKVLIKHYNAHIEYVTLKRTRTKLKTKLARKKQYIIILNINSGIFFSDILKR